MAKISVQPPDLNSCKTYEAYKRELSAWEAVTDLVPTKQGNYIALSLPNQSKFGNDLKERAFENISVPVDCVLFDVLRLSLIEATVQREFDLTLLLHHLLHSFSVSNPNFFKWGSRTG